MVYIDDKKLQMAFIEEVSELIEQLNESLMELENDPENEEVINAIFRYAHSIKSEAALVGFTNMSTIAHKMEDIFERVRRKVLLVNTDIMNSLFNAHDRLNDIVVGIQSGGNDSDHEIQDVVNPLLEILKEEEGQKKEPPKSSEGTTLKQKADYDDEVLAVSRDTLKDITSDFSDEEKKKIEQSIEDGETFFKIRFTLDTACEMRYPRVYLVYNNFNAKGTVLKTIPDIEAETDDEKFKSLELYYLTDIGMEELEGCADVDQVDQLEVFTIDPETLKSKLNIEVKGYEPHEILSQSEIDEAEKIEREWDMQLEKEYKNKDKSPAGDKEAGEEGAHKEEGEAEDKGVSKEKEETAAKSSKQRRSTKSVQKQTIRVDIDRLDNLLNLVGELIINKSQFKQIYDNISDKQNIMDFKAELEDATNVLDRITERMQAGMMQARMVPIGNVFQKFPRMVRDLAHSLGKEVNLVITGETTEIDRTVIELIADPLAHLIRNSVDHGLETPVDRKKAGKNVNGTVNLRAFQEGSNIYIEVKDDGQGIDVEAVKEKAIEKGLTEGLEFSSMTQSEILNYIFHPGFSTKKEITSTSGRGVGMDVVKTQIEKLRGTVEIQTSKGEGTKFTIQLPLTTSIIDALLVSVKNNIFAIPITIVEDTLRVEKHEIKDFDEYQVYDLRGETLAIVYLSDLVGLDVKHNEEDTFIVVVSFERRRIGLVVSALMGEFDIVIKPLDEALKTNEGIAGAAILGDGRIALILDTSTMIKSKLREINRRAKEHNFYEDDQMVSINEFYDSINKGAIKAGIKKEKSEAQANDEENNVSRNGSGVENGAPAPNPPSDAEMPSKTDDGTDDKYLSAIQNSLKDLADDEK